MKLSQPSADIFLSDPSLTPEAALARTTHLCVIAHQDDIEINAYPAVAECYGRADRFFTGVVMTNGAGSARTGKYAHVADAEMQRIRREEQRSAAKIGGYNLQIQLAHTSADVKSPGHPGVAADLTAIFANCHPTVVYLHQPADKHDTHVACLLRCIEALRALPCERRPARVLGVEAWRNLDWLDDDQKVPLDASPHPVLAAELIAVFDSQIAGGKRYDLAALGRRASNATFYSSHTTDKLSDICWAMDLTPLVHDASISVREYTRAYVDRFRDDVDARLAKFS